MSRSRGSRTRWSPSWAVGVDWDSVQIQRLSARYRSVGGMCKVVEFATGGWDQGFLFHSSSLDPRGFKACMVGLHCPRLPGTPKSQVAVPTRRPTPSDSLTLSTLLDWAQEHRMRSSAGQWSPCFCTVLRTYSVVRKEDCCCVSLAREMLGVLHNARCDACDGCNALL